MSNTYLKAAFSLLMSTEDAALVRTALADDRNSGAGHIRWGKAIKGLVGKLGEFTAATPVPLQVADT